MTYIFHEPTGEIIDDDGQVIATLSDNALPEQGEALVRAYNNDGSLVRKCCVLLCLQLANELRASGNLAEANGATIAANAIGAQP